MLSVGRGRGWTGFVPGFGFPVAFGLLHNGRVMEERHDGSRREAEEEPSVWRGDGLEE